MRLLPCWALIFGICLWAGLVSWADEITLRLARDLSAEGDHRNASIEFRRLALASENPARATYAWFAAYERFRGGDAPAADRLLDLAEDERVLPSEAVSILRGEIALARREPAEAAFYFESAMQAAEGEAAEYATRRATVAHLRAKNRSAAQQVAGRAAPEAQAAIKAYDAGRDKSPRLGGWLGIVPGLGYAYAGEYANAVRSAILNGLFIWGMVETAEREMWGAFAVISFFEITWYTGSIYGGIDASHRFNRRRLDQAETAIMAGYTLMPDYDAIPAIRIQYRF